MTTINTQSIIAKPARHELPAKLDGLWRTLIRDYQIAKAESELAEAKESDEREALNDAHTDAVDAILLTPAECVADIRRKIEIMDTETIDDGWWCAREAFALLAIDARRLLPIIREGAKA